MVKSEDDEDVIEHLTASNGWKVFTQRKRASTPQDEELKALLLNIRRRQQSAPTTRPDEPDDPPEAA